jgi:hypothetical protein
MILRIGSNGSAVAQLQLNLNQLAQAGHFKLPKGKLQGTGTFGENTEATVKAFQRAQKMEIDGIVGPDTLERIDELRGKAADSTVGAIDERSRGAVIDSLIAIAQAEVGVREVGGNNCGVRVREYQRATDLRPLGDWPWCAAFISWVIREWLNSHPEACRALGWKHEEIEAKRPKTPGVFAYIDWARRFDQEILPPTSVPEPGMVAVFDFSHICFVKAPVPGGKFKSIEGNTNGRGDRDSVTGDGVWEKVRPSNLVRKFIRWRFVAAPGEGTFISNAVPVSTALPNTHGIGEIPREVIEFMIDEEGMDQP